MNLAMLAVPTVTVHFFFISRLIAFPYVTIILSLVMASDELTNPVKDKYYLSRCLFMSVPVNVVAWVEATACHSFLQQYGGHFWYDNAIPTSALAFFAYVVATQDKKKQH